MSRKPDKSSKASSVPKTTSNSLIMITLPIQRKERRVGVKVSVELTQREANIIEGLRAGDTITTINSRHGYIKASTASRVHFFLERGWVVQPKRATYEVPLTDYVINDHLCRNSKLAISRQKANMQSDNVPHNIAAYLQANYRTKPRSKLARELNIPKYTLNYYLIEMRLGS